MLVASLPDLDSLDLEAVKALLIAQHERYTATLSSRASEIERLVLLVEKLQRMLFGAKSEKVLRQIEQLEFQLEDLQAASAIEEAQAIPPAERPRSAKPFRRPLPEHLPREVHTHMPGHEACPDCGGRLRELGEDVAEMLEYVRACFKVIRHVRPKFACNGCDRVVEAPAPSRPIDRGLAGPGLLAHVLVSKYADHQPLYRQSEIYAREGVDLDRSTLAGWVGATSELLAPLVEAVRDHVMSASKLHADDTPVPVLAPGNGRTKTGRLWTYVRDDRPSGDTTAPAVWFAYSPDRKGEKPTRTDWFCVRTSFAASSSFLRRTPVMGAKMRIPFSPLMTLRPNWFHAYIPATRVPCWARSARNCFCFCCCFSANQGRRCGQDTGPQRRVAEDAHSAADRGETSALKASRPQRLSQFLRL
jgi:transposase